MDIRKLQRAIVDGLEDVKAQHIEVFNTEALSPLFERVIVASGTSNRQTKALASSVRETVKARGFPVLSVEGEDNGEWIIVDCAAAVCHIMQPAIREYYRLEEIWGDKPVRMKMAGASRPAQAAEELPEAMPAAAKRPSPPAKGPAAGAKKAPAAGRKASAGARKVPAARKAAAKKGAAAKRQSGPARQPLAAKRGGQPPRRRA
jgi:ribosome-associated protein